jgi:protein-disulfide isomerase
MKRNRLWLLLVLLPLAIILALVLGARAQEAKQGLHPPQGAKVALVVFEDLQCPDSAKANPLLEEAARKYNTPLVRYDFPLPRHMWAMNAAVLDRYFDSQSRKLGDEFRDAVFKNQTRLNQDNLRAFAEKFAREHDVELPSQVDPDGALAGQVESDFAMGRQLGVTHTPTIYVVNDQRSGSPFVETVNRSELFQMIEAMKQEAE